MRKKTRSKITDEEVLEIFRFRSNGMSAANIAKMFNTTWLTIRKILLRISHRGVYVPEDLLTKANEFDDRRLFTDEEESEIYSLYLSGTMSQREIADRFGVNPAVVSIIISRKRNSS